MSIFESNLAAVRRLSSQMADVLERQHSEHGEPTQLGSFSVEPSRSGRPTLRYAPASGEGFYIHSPYDPQREAEQFAAQALTEQPQSNLTVVFGLGLGYHALELVRRLPASDRVVIVEPHWELLYLALCHLDLTELLTRSKLTLTTNDSGSGLLGFMNSVELASFKGLRLVSNPVFDRLPQAETYKTVATRLRYEMMAFGGNFQTLMVMGEMQQMNVLLNFDQLLDNPPFLNLMGEFAGKPAIIVSAGPSLEKNMHRLTELSDRALIIAVDTATKPLLRAGITPHMVVTGDPQEANARHLWGVDLPRTYLVAEPQSPVSAVAQWTGPKFICSFHDNMMQWVDRLLGDRGRLNVWGSVAIMAFDAAVKLGADPIIFIGQDLSFPGGRTYVSGTYFETEEQQELTADKLREKGDALIEMTDIHGQPVLTNRQMFAYFNYLSDQFLRPEALQRSIINATEGGILHGPRVTVMPLDEVINTLLQQEWDVWARLANAHARPQTYNTAAAIADTERMLAGLRTAAENCRRGLGFVTRTITAVQASDGSEAATAAVEAAYKRMSELRMKMLRDRQLMKIVEMSNHAGIFAFTQGLVELTREAEQSGQTDHLRQAYHHHTLYSSTADAVERLIPLFEHCLAALLSRAGSAAAEPVRPVVLVAEAAVS